MDPQNEILRLADEQDDVGATALMKQTSAADLSLPLLEDGTNILQCLAARNKTQLLRLAIEKGLDVNMRDNEGQSPLMAAALELSQEAVHTLLSMKACPDLQDEEGMTALHWSMGCLSHDRRAVVETLLGSGADYQLRDKENNTVRDIAVKWSSSEYPGYKEVVSMIDAEEYKFYLWLSRKTNSDSPRTLNNIFTRICHKICPAYKTTQTQEDVFRHVATRNLNYDMFVELMSLF